MDTVVRGIPIWLLREYAVDAGGEPQPDGSVKGDGWVVALTQLDDFRVGSLAVGQVRLQITGTPAGIAEIRSQLEPRFLRGGG